VSFVKFSRDRRGYEHFYLVEPVTGRRGKTRQRVLYWFRTPPNVKVGREPFDPQVMRALENRYPGVKFDWDQLRNTPIPSVEPEYWRERRRVERAVRRLQEDEDAQALAVEPPTPEPDASELLPPDVITPPRVSETPADVPNAAESSEGAALRIGREGLGSRRRRRRRRGQSSTAAPGPSSSGDPQQTESSAGASIDANEVMEDDPDDSADE